MNQAEVFPDFTDHKGQNHHQDHRDSISFRLPTIDRLPRVNVKSKAETRQNVALPSIKSIPPHQHHGLKHTDTQKRLLIDQAQDIALQIEQKLRQVMGNVHQGEGKIDFEDQNDMDFQELVNHNREILKQQLHRGQHRNHINNLMEGREERKSGKNKSKTVKQNNKVDHAFERIIKEHRAVSPENKQIQKRRESIAHKNEIIQKASLVGRAKEDGPFSMNRIELLPKQRQKHSIHSIKQKIYHRQKLVTQQASKSNLFDNIQNFLQNPNKNLKLSNPKKTNKGNIKDLEQKLRAINQKLGLNEHLQTKSTEQNIDFQQKTFREWKRIEINSRSNLKCVHSNFDKEMERVGYLQKKNSAYLTICLDNQKMIMELDIIKKMSPHSKIDSNS